jgi:hypothetical protein
MSTVDVEITIKRQRGRPGRKSRSAEQKVEAPRIRRITRLLALAIKFQDMVDRGEVRDYADLARLGFVTRARLTQIMNLLLLAPEIQEGILRGTNAEPIAERQVRSIVKIVLWEQQRLAWRKAEKRETSAGSK